MVVASLGTGEGGGGNLKPFELKIEFKIFESY
jgi:hypothetical protein